MSWRENVRFGITPGYFEDGEYQVMIRFTQINRMRCMSFEGLACDHKVDET